MFSLLTFILSVCNGRNFSELPAEVVSQKIFGCLSIPDKSKSVADLNRAGHHHFRLYHQEEFDLYAKLLSEINKTDNFCVGYLDKIETTTQKLQFSELWSLLLPDTLKVVGAHYWYEAELILAAMDMHTMSISEFKRIHALRNSSSVELDILILASRALVCLSVWLLIENSLLNWT